LNPTLNAYQQPVGPAVPDWTPRQAPQRISISGHYCRLEPLDAQRHAAELHASYTQAMDGRDWTYMFAGPFDDLESYRRYVEKITAASDPLHYAVIDLDSARAVGTLALMRIDTTHGSIEVGHVMFSPLLKRTPISTEAQYLLMQHVFAALGYRRYEWKCDSLNAPSRRAAERLGFQFEGIFRQHLIYKGRSRDTAWFAVTDQDWPWLQRAFTAWFAPGNFDAQGRQRRSLSEWRATVRSEG